MDEAALAALSMSCKSLPSSARKNRLLPTPYLKSASELQGLDKNSTTQNWHKMAQKNPGAKERSSGSEYDPLSQNLVRIQSDVRQR
jgi:hypothetical protein